MVSTAMLEAIKGVPLSLASENKPRPDWPMESSLTEADDNIGGA